MLYWSAVFLMIAILSAVLSVGGIAAHFSGLVRLARAHQAVLMPVIAWEPPGGERAERICPSGPLREEFRNQACHRLRDALVAVWGEIPGDPMVQPRASGWMAFPK